MIKSISSLTATGLLCVLSLYFSVVGAAGQAARPASAPPPSTGTAQSSASSAPPRGNTVLHITDQVHITVYGEEDLTTEARIEKDGTIRFPLLGSVSLAGKTIEQATQDIRSQLAARFIRNPLVNLTITTYAVERVTVMGEVRSPGQVEIPVEGGHDLLGVIALAGGFTDIAEIAHISVRRVVDGKAEVFVVNAKTMTHDGKANSFYVQPGDIITVRQRMF